MRMPYAIGNAASSVTPVMISHVSLPSQVGVMESTIWSLDLSCDCSKSNAPTPRSKPSSKTYNPMDRAANPAQRRGMSIALPPHRGIGVRAIQHVGTERVLEGPRGLSLEESQNRSSSDNMRHKEKKCGHEEGVDTYKCDECREERLRRDRRNRIDRSQQAEDHPGLAAGLGHIPSAKRRNNARRSHRHQEAKKPLCCKEPALPSKPQRACRHSEHQNGDTVHDAESVKDHAHDRLRVPWGVLQALHSVMKTVREPDAA